MFEALFGSEMPLAARFFIAFVIVLALIALAAWLVRRFSANRLASATRGRQPRLAVIDAASVDGRRRLILIRRDNIEHLLMIGGPTDVVVEQNIVRAAAARDLGGREQPRVAMPADSAPRAVPLGDAGSWPLQPEPTPVPAPAARSYRTTTEEPWIAPEIPARARTEMNTSPPDITAKLSADLGVTPRQPAVAPLPTAIPAREPVPSAEPAQTDHNLAEMAQRLEAALRRPGAGDLHPPATDPLAAPFAAPPVATQREVKPVRAEPKFEPKLETKFESRPEPRAEQASTKSAYDSLEQEMASLLGRPSGKT